MDDLIIEVEDEVVSLLSARATRNGPSLDAEVLQILRDTAKEEDQFPDSAAERT
jgi:plasmid stability protein